MKIQVMVVTAIIFLVCGYAMAEEALVIDNNFQSKKIVKYFQYLEDPGKDLTIDGAVKSAAWKTFPKDSVNFGFTKSAYWFRFTVDKKEGTAESLFFELSYPLLNYIDFYLPSEEGFRIIKTGNKYPFSQREIEDTYFVFPLNKDSGVSTYYMRIDTESSVNFIPTVMTQMAYLKQNQRKLPVIWIYYGLMIIMVIYNFFIFTASKDRGYFFYILFITSYILFQMTLNGYSFHYLWPDAVWWGSHSLPFFMLMSVFLAAVFMRDVINTKNHFRILDRIFLYGVMVPSSGWAFGSLLVNYSTAIRIATVLVGVLSLAIFVIIVIALLKKSREARFFAAGFLGLVLGIFAYVLKTFGVLPEMFITEWGVQIGSSLVVVLMSLALADKINVMRRDLKGLLAEQKENERIARERSVYLEGVVGTATGLVEEFVKVSDDLQEITDRFSGLSLEQSATSEEMSSTFEELASSVDNIYHATINQKEEGGKSKHLVGELDTAQKGLLEQNRILEENIQRILMTATDTGESLARMHDTMNIINEGGKEITRFIDMIDDISDRINLLSLNAAIEAARAGDYGRGFAVVADEIGKLAQATSDNSKEISRQISRIISDIESGASIVNNTKESTDNILKMVGDIGFGVDAVKEMMLKQNRALEMVIHQTDVIDSMSRGIASSTNEQRIGMDQSVKTISRLAEMAQEIAHSNSMIIDFTKVIHEKALELNRVIHYQI